MKDVASCDMLGRGASDFWPRDLRMWNMAFMSYRKVEQRRELKHLSTGRKRKQFSDFLK